LECWNIGIMGFGKNEKVVVDKIYLERNAKRNL
jgi:hypothetical protein